MQCHLLKVDSLGLTYLFDKDYTRYDKIDKDILLETCICVYGDITTNYFLNRFYDIEDDFNINN